jgi:hypothetical protein
MYQLHRSRGLDRLSITSRIYTSLTDVTQLPQQQAARLHQPLHRLSLHQPLHRLSTWAARFERASPNVSATVFMAGCRDQTEGERNSFFAVPGPTASHRISASSVCRQLVAAAYRYTDLKSRLGCRFFLPLGRSSRADLLTPQFLTSTSHIAASIGISDHARAIPWQWSTGQDGWLGAGVKIQRAGLGL